MGVVLIGAGVTLWWLTPDLLRAEEENSRFVWGERSPWERHPNGMRAYYETGSRVLSLLTALGGVVLLVVQVARL
jgi:hypothetical protein